MINFKQPITGFDPTGIIRRAARPHVRHDQRQSIQGAAVQHQVRTGAAVLREAAPDGDA